MKKLAFYVFLFATLTGCSNGGTGGGSNKTIYSDNAKIVDGSLTISFTNLSEYKAYSSETYSVSFTMNLLSSNPKPVEYKISSPKFVRESNKAEYSVDYLFINPTTLTLECDIAKTYSFSTTLPTSIGTDNYYFSFKGNSTAYKFCLYETPDELRSKVTVKYVVDGSEVGSKAIPQGRKLSSFDWTSSDYIFGCNEWFSDSSLKNKIDVEFSVSENMTVYGSKTTILKYNTPSGTNSSFVSGYNFIPSNGEVVVPKNYDGKSIYSILAGSFRDEVAGMKKIYIPKISNISSVSNFSDCKDLETVYFEGSEAEWNSINEATFKSNVKFVFNQYK